MTIDRDQLTACARELTDRDNLWQRLHEHLEADLAAMMKEDKAKPKKQPVAPSPWNDSAAHLISEIAAGARRHETSLTLLLFDRARYRGGDDRNTYAALTALPALITAAAERHPADPNTKSLTEQPWQYQRAAYAATDLALWPTRCRALLDELRTEEEPWTKAPQGLNCPYCERRLHLAPGTYADEAAIMSARLTCRDCPTRLLDETDRHINRHWAANEWIGMLQEGAAA